MAGWRWPAYLCSIFVPQAFVIVEFFFNRIQMPAHLFWIPVLICTAYLVLSFAGQNLLSQPIYPYTLDWTFTDSERTAHTMTFIAILYIGVIFFFYLFLYLNRFKNSYFGKEQTHTRRESLDGATPLAIPDTAESE